MLRGAAGDMFICEGVLMANLNSVMLIGRLTRDPEVKTIPGGASLCKFGLATNERYKDDGGNPREVTCFVEVETWRKLAEICGRYLKKGREVFVAGKLKFHSWEAKDGGGKRSRLTISARQIQFLGAKPNGGGRDGAADAPRPGETVEVEEEPEDVNF